MKRKIIRTKLVEVRKNVGSQSKVSTDLGISRQFMSAIENGERNPTVKLMAKMASYFKESPNNLFPDLFFECESHDLLRKTFKKRQSRKEVI